MDQQKQNALDAVSSGNFELLKKCIEDGVDIETKDRDKRTLLVNAVFRKRMDMVVYLIQKGADVNAQDSGGWTALHAAAQDLSCDMCKLLMENGAAIDTQDKWGNTPLGRAVFNTDSNGDVIKLFLHHGADRDLENYSGISPWKLACGIGNYDVKQFFEE